MEQRLVAGRYRLDEQLGVGGMAEVWAAEDLELGRRVALKLLSRDADPARFEREAHAVAALAHPNICHLYDYGEAGGRPFMVLEYLPGGTLEDRLVPDEPLPDDEAARIATELAGALAHAHARGLVHRDLKPANVLFDDEGRAKIGDFGIARVRGAGTLTEAGTLLGTAAYISPEQAQGLPAAAASDVYSFGVIVFRMLTGRLPFESTSALELAAKHVNDPAPPVRQRRPDAPPVLAALVDAALAKDPTARPPDGAALVAALEPDAAPTLSGAPAVAAPAAPTVVIPRRAAPRRRMALPAALAAVVLLGGAGVAVAILATRGSGSEQKQPPAAKPRPRRSASAPTTAVAVTSSPTTSTTPATTAPTTTRAPVTLPPAPPPTPVPTTSPEPPPPPTTATTVPTTTTTPTTTAPPPPPPPA